MWRYQHCRSSLHKMYPNTTTTNKEEFFLKKRFRIKAALYISCAVILGAIATAIIVFLLKYHQTKHTGEISVDFEKYPPEIKKALKNNSLVIGAKKSEQLILPGTKWCGKGTIALSYDDLGVAREVDICCRAHDICPGHIKSGETLHGIENTGFFEWSDCHCDETFHNCLKNVNNFVSNAVGFIYFNVLGPKCFRREYSVIGCQKFKYTTYAYDKRDQKRCVEPIFDKGGPKIYQWFDNRLYY